LERFANGHPDVGKSSIASKVACTRRGVQIQSRRTRLPRNDRIRSSPRCVDRSSRRQDDASRVRQRVARPTQRLAFRTNELYTYLLESHIMPSLGNATLIGLAPSKIRSWHASLARDHPSTAAKAYRLLSAILRTAVTDGLLVSSPCKVAGGGVERPAERPVATVREVEALEAAMPEHLRLIVLLATWCQLRRAELLGLRRRTSTSLTVR